MGQWSIGPIVGQYQPEDFTEKQSVNYEEPKAFGIVPPLIFKSWSPREVTLSFVVNAMVLPGVEQARNDGIPNAPNQSDPEVVWATIVAMMRPGDGLLPPQLGGSRLSDPRRFPKVVIPGWDVGGTTPDRALVVDASIKRTHIAGNPSRAVRAIITVTLRELSAVLGKGQRLRGFHASETIGTQKARATGLPTFTQGGAFLPPAPTQAEEGS